MNSGIALADSDASWRGGSTAGVWLGSEMVSDVRPKFLSAASIEGPFGLVRVKNTLGIRMATSKSANVMRDLLSVMRRVAKKACFGQRNCQYTGAWSGSRASLAEWATKTTPPLGHSMPISSCQRRRSFHLRPSSPRGTACLREWK